VMRVGILGGTGKLGLAFAVRLVTAGYSVSIGSRDAAKAIEAAKSISEQIIGTTNREAAASCDMAFVSVPYSGHRALLEPLRNELRNKIVVDATVPIDPENLFHIKTDSGKSAAEETMDIIPEASIFAAFQTISHRILRKPGVKHDVLVAGGRRRKSDVIDLIRSIELNPIDAGPIEVAGHLERMTVLLLSINKANKVKESGIKITGI
jgi:8-hydroxy-5-deazaflavin:NADPH oxidoreductase